ncbi:MAG: right-handed parallel beta-helix repeat-containing protein [Candidatus Aminicenantes bacterium]|nr:right-handed parallel beta-helix repeat-containing protein [Candidatus Aminicenantes bacterium]
MALVPSFAAAASKIAEVKTYANFETAGVIVKVSGMDFDESATIEYRKAGAFAYRRGHDFIRYDGNHMATSLFGLDLNTAYEIRITLTDPDGTSGRNPVSASFKTKKEYVLPKPLRVVKVSNQNQLDRAIRNAKPGDEIRLAAGTYAKGIHIYGSKSGTAENPITIASQTMAKPLIKGTSDGGVELEGVSHLVLNNLEIHNERGDGIGMRGCHDIVVRKCYVHDSRPGDYTNNIFIQHGDEGSPACAGHYLIIDNAIGDDRHERVDENQGPGPTNVNVAGQSYFGICVAYQPGPFLTIRGNTIYGTVDGIHCCGDEGGSPVLDPDDPDLLDTWRDQNLDVYDNVIYDCKDDGIECDGHMVNGRIFRNRIGKCENAVSVAPFYPGPLFVLRNYAHGFHQGCLKQNTGVEGVSRNVLVYHNTFMEKARGAKPHCGDEHCLYRGEPALQRDFVYKNNIFYARGRVYNGDLYTPDNYHKNDAFDSNLMFSTRQTDRTHAYKWVCGYGDALNNSRYATLSAFRAAVKQEKNGTWGDPKLVTTPLKGYPKNSKLLDLGLKSGSPAIDAGIVIPGINDAYAGKAPDIGARERTSTGAEREP